MTLSAGENKFSFERVSGNSCGVSLQHIRCLKLKFSQEHSLILTAMTSRSVCLEKKSKIQKRHGGSKSPVVFTAGLHGTVLVENIKFVTMMCWWLEALIQTSGYQCQFQMHWLTNRIMLQWFFSGGIHQWTT